MTISIITINYNNSILTFNFIKSVIAHTNKCLQIEFIIVDNCSVIKEYNLLKKNINSLTGNIKLIRSNVNLGFGGGNMLGNQHATGKYLGFINNDILFTEDCFSSLIKHHEETPNCGLNTPQQYDRHNNPTYCFDYFHGIRKELFGRKFIKLTSKNPIREKKHYNKIIYPNFTQGCFMFFKADAFAEVGGFDNNIFLYYEEMDICYRLKQKGYSSALHPQTKFTHLQGESINKNYLIKQELKISYLYTVRKNYPFYKYQIIRFLFSSKLFFKSILNPKYFKLLGISLTGKYLENSLKQKQKIKFL